jgi:tRNA modification GTPase
VEDLDFPMEGLLRSKNEIRDLVATYRTGRIYQEGGKVVLAGRTNAGKSSLFNLFLKEERSIVSEVHGTTGIILSPG